ncbi:hypothetical protein HPB51_010710 [Rhipicephalus microplus]|uniref:Uncharacterized protein n=1 Tax=Rhipicephalus microplus TaxID=6941 RepID=A0A9J6F1P0_RHIMP|nr:hypothetical protein HPB51_010710 [Rhipicephalus microplus]
MAAPKASTGRLYFSIAYDLSLLREVNAHNQFQDPSRWGGIVKNMNLALGKVFSVRALRERLDLLMAQFLANDRASLRKSGTEEEYDEKERLLQEICSLARDFGYKNKSRKAQSSAGQRVSGVVTRDTAAATLVPASQVAFEPLSADATFDDATQSAADLLERISQGTDIAATPGHSDETTTTANNQWQEASTNAEDRPDTAGAAQVVPRRRRAQGVTASADYEFIEKRWRHERALKDKEHALEMERLAVEKLRIERKQERSEKRHELKRNRTERELQLREREMEIRERQLQAQLDEASQREKLSRFYKATQDAILKIVETICDKLAK